MTTWLNLLAIGLGGAAGSIIRYVVTVVATTVPGGSTFWGTTLVNIVGCAALGALAEYTRITEAALVEAALSTRTSVAIRVGFLGALTTFSTFAGESLMLAEEGRPLAAATYVAANFCIGLIALIAAAMWVKGWMT